MTWVEALPTIGILYALGSLVFFCTNHRKNFDYRGTFDNRVPPNNFDNRWKAAGRLSERDVRMALQPTTVEWIHPVWRPNNYRE